jgi:curved DNA-binding protein CbpA
LRLSQSYSTTETQKILDYVTETQEARTYPRECEFGCGALVFYHTNGNGDKVLFDSLGAPWQVHKCWEEYWQEESARRRLLNDQNHNRQKLLILIGAIREIENNGSVATEQIVASQIGLSVEQLKTGYRHLYTVAPVRSSYSAPVRGDHLRLDLELEFRDAVFGCDKEIRIPQLETCKVCSGSGAKTGTLLLTCLTCNGTRQIIEQKCEVCDGQGRKETTKKLKITIPPGVDNGTRLRVSREGDAGQYGGTPGDLYIYLSVNEDPEFQRDGINILSEIKISRSQAIQGCRLQINTLDEPVELVIPAGTKHLVLTLENRGIPKLGNPQERGDHLLTVLVE